MDRLKLCDAIFYLFTLLGCDPLLAGLDLAPPRLAFSADNRSRFSSLVSAIRTCLFIQLTAIDALLSYKLTYCATDMPNSATTINQTPHCPIFMS